MSISPTELRDKQDQFKPSARRYVWLVVAVVVVATALYLFAGRRSANNAPNESATPVDYSLGRLYTEAKKDLKNKKWRAAAGKFKQLANISPGYKDAVAQAKAAAGKLYDEAAQDIAKGDYNQAQDKLETVASVDPKNKKAKQKLKEVKDKTGGGSPAQDPNQTASDTSSGDSDVPGDGATLKPIPADATPVSLLVSPIDGYKTVQNGWLKNPLEAGSTYIPLSSEVRVEIDRVLLTIDKYDDNEAAAAKLSQEKEAFPLETENMHVNGHDAYTGIYSFQGSSQFFELRQLATIAWTRNNWFFSIQVLPKGTPASDYKKGIARDVAIKFGY